MVPAHLRAEMIASEARFLREIPRWDPEEAIDSLIANQGGAYGLIHPFLGNDSQVLEIGSGNGLGLCDLLKRKVDVVGVEPGRTRSFEGRYDRACALLEANGLIPASRYVVPGFGEDLPFADASFDLVFSIAVLEHVKDPEKVIREAIRVTRVGGTIVMNVPNYWAWYEAHYDMVWLPWLCWSKRLARAYVRFRGRPDYYVDELRFLTPGSLTGAVRGVTARSYPFSSGPMGRVSALAWYLGEERPGKHPVIDATRGRLVGRALSSLARALAGAQSALGFSPVFTLVIHK